MSRNQRTDPHRPGAIIPANYDQWCDYSLAGMDGCPAFGLDCTQPVPTGQIVNGAMTYTRPTCPDSGRCCVASAHRLAEREGHRVFGHKGKCGVCGAHFRHGSVFRHDSGELVHMGHDCAAKYEMMADLSAHEIALGRIERAHAVAIERDRKAQARVDFLGKHPGLEAALAADHRIIADIAARFTQHCTLSDKQVALVLKLADEVQNPKPPKPEERAVTAPTGKQTFEGEVVSAKIAEGDWGSAWKITIKVTTADGVWLAWGTAPRSILDTIVARADAQDKAQREAWAAEAARKAAAGENPGSYPGSRLDRGDWIRRDLVGARVRIKATLERPMRRDASECETDSGRAKVEERNARDNFVFMKRPTGELVVQS